MRLDNETRALFRQVAPYLAKRQGKDDKALAAKLTRIANGGEVGKRDGFTNADANIVQAHINVLCAIGQQNGPHAEDARLEAELLERYQAAVRKLCS